MFPILKALAKGLIATDWKPELAYIPHERLPELMSELPIKKPEFVLPESDHGPKPAVLSFCPLVHDEP